MWRKRTGSGQARRSVEHRGHGSVKKAWAAISTVLVSGAGRTARLGPGLLLFAAIIVVAGCAGADDRVAAAQKAFDASHLAWTSIESGEDCYDGVSQAGVPDMIDPDQYVGLPGVVVGPKSPPPAHLPFTFSRPIQYCRVVSWDHNALMSSHDVSIGRYVV